MSITAYQGDDGRWHWQDADGTTSEDIGEIGYGSEDTAIALNIGAALTDTDGSESISSVVISGVPTGAVLSAENVRAIRPGLGLPPKWLEAVLGRRLRVAVKRGTPLAWDLLENP